MATTTINLDPARPAIMALNLSELVDLYLRDARLRVQGRTADSYNYLLSLLLEWWAEAGPALGYRLDARAWNLYGLWLARRPSVQSEEPLSLSTREKALAVCRQLLGWAYRHGYLDRDFRDQVPKVREDAPKRSAPSRAALARLLAAAGESRNPVRDTAIIAFLIGTGVRRAEAAGVDVDDLQFLADGSGLCSIVGKNKKHRTVAFDARCGGYLLALLDELGRRKGPLFCGWHGSRLTPKGLYEAVKAAMRRAGIDSRGAGPHDLRRAFATEWLRERRSLGDGQLLAMQLGHTSETMSVHYSRPTLEDLLNGFESPLEKLEHS